MLGSDSGAQVAQAHLHVFCRQSSTFPRCSAHTLQLQPRSFGCIRRHIPPGAAMRLLVAGLCVASVSGGQQTHGHCSERGHAMPGLTHFGYLLVDPDAGSKLFYMFYEAQERAGAEQPPICLWLQAGPPPHLCKFFRVGPK